MPWAGSPDDGDSFSIGVEPRQKIEAMSNTFDFEKSDPIPSPGLAKKGAARRSESPARPSHGRVSVLPKQKEEASPPKPRGKRRRRRKKRGPYSAELLERFEDLKTGEHGMDTRYLHDLVRLRKLILDKDQMVEHLGDLEQTLGAGGESQKKSLTNALEAKEKEHGFSVGLTALGFLEPEEFSSLPARGYLFKDPGAQPLHGEFTHRLQWHAIMSHFEQHKDAWHHTPYELYTKIGERDQNAARAEGTHNLFGHLMDQPGTNDEAGFRHPDSVMRILTTDPTHKTLGQILRKRREKRMDQIFQGMSDHGLKSNAALELALNQGREKKVRDGRYTPFDLEDREKPLILRVGAERMTAENVAERRKTMRRKWGKRRRVRRKRANRQASVDDVKPL